MSIVADRPLAPAAQQSVTEGVAVVMPAYEEEANLARTVVDFLDALDGAKTPHSIVVVNDGSHDRTGEVLDELVQTHPGRVMAVHHETNRGYGAAVRSGIDAALGQTDLRWVLLTDADGQFRAADILTFLDIQRTERADAVIGYRRHRADPLVRKVNAWLWNQLSRLVLRIRSRDVDCAFKLIDRRLLDGMPLMGEAAAISPELLARMSVQQPRIVEHPVEHHPREHGANTGARLPVIIRSLVSLAQVYLHLVRDAHKQPWVRRLLRPADPVLRVLTLVAATLSVGSYLYFSGTGAALSYPDGTSHLLIARRVLESPTAGLAQLGGVWLPLPHLLALPLVGNDWFYHTGLAGAAISMVSFVVAVRYLYLLGTDLAGTRLAGVATALVFAVNTNVLYLQGTAMTETLLFACVAAAIYYLNAWCRHGRYRDLVATSVAVLLGTLTRYEGWVLCLAVLAVIAYVETRRHRQYARLEASLIFYGFIALSGIVLWLVWNVVIFGDPLYWKDGEYAASSLWVSEGELAVGSLDIAARTYWLAMTHTAGILTVGLGALGMVVYLVRTRLRAETAAVYPLLAFGVFFVYALYSGQRPLHVKEISGDLYNLRFGLIMLLPAAVFTGYLVSLPEALVARLDRSTRPTRPTMVRAAQAAAAVGILAAALAVPGVVTLDEARSFRASDREDANAAAAAWLRTYHDGGLTLMMSYDNESVTFDSRIDTAKIIYEGSYRMWEPALRDPAAMGIRWVYMRAAPGQEDRVWRELYGTPALESRYQLVYAVKDRLVYRLRASSTAGSSGSSSDSAPTGRGN